MEKFRVMRRRRAGQATWLWMIIALAFVAGFLIWLAMTSQPTQVPVAALPTDSMAPPTGGVAQVISPTAFQTQMKQLWGQDVELQDAEVSSALGTQMFWLQLPSGEPFLVKLDSALVAAGQTVPSTGHITVVGRVLQKTDSTLAAWQQSGALQTKGQQAQAEFGTTFIEARALKPSPGR